MRISDNALFPLEVPLWAAVIVCVPICIHIFFQEAINSISQQLSLFDSTKTAWHFGKLASFPRKTAHNSRFSSAVRNLPGMKYTMTNKLPSLTTFMTTSTEEKEKDCNQYCFGACALTNLVFQKLLETLA